MAADVLLNPADCSLDCQLQGPVASTLSDEGFGYLWSGVRATHGITSGRFWFSVRVLEPLETTAANIGESADAYNDDETAANTIHCCRVGVSRPSVDVGSLGSHQSWGYGSTGKKSTGNMYQPYPANQRRCFGPGDEVACFVDLSPAAPNSIASISFAVNCQHLGTAFELFHKPDPSNAATALFPHVLLKNVAVVVNLKGEQPRGWPQEQQWSGSWLGCLPWQASVAADVPVALGPVMRPFEQCTVVMMVGLPGSGKSHHAARMMSPQSAKLQPQGSRTLLHQQPQQQQQQQQQQQYLLLSTEAIVKQMKVTGLRRGGAAGASAARTSELLGQAEEVFERLLEAAAARPGNYILDCPNVSRDERRRRLAPFREAGFRIAAAVVLEEEAELHRRLARRGQGLCPAPEDLLDMQANFALPEVSPEEFDEVTLLSRVTAFTQPQAAAELVHSMRCSAQQQLQALQDSGWNYACLGGSWRLLLQALQQQQQQQQQYGSSDLANALSSSSSFGYQADTAGYGPSQAAAAAAAARLPPSRAYGRNPSQGFYSPGSVSRRTSSASSGGSFSSALPPAVGAYVEEDKQKTAGAPTSGAVNGAAAAGLEAAAAVSHLFAKQPQQSQQQQQQQQQHRRQRQQPRDAFDELFDQLTGSMTSTPSTASSSELDAAAALELSPALLEQLQQLQLPNLAPEALVAAFQGQGASKQPPKKLGRGSFGMMAHCRHQHLVALKGYCLSKRVLVFEYCSRGSLEDWLVGRHSFTKGAQLSWRQRLQLAHQSSSSTPGCFYYLPDEYNIYGVVSCGLDTFSFGLTLVNMITGDLFCKPRLLRWKLAEALATFEASLEAAAAAAAPGAAAGVLVAGMLDPTAGQWPPCVAAGFAMLALACSEPERRKRPGMKDVVAALAALQQHVG
ncbi:hypothetical protein OEZ86_001552 [Tetradesmus obliquus]|nr:hypothetical protein OEZ86_001552 [Tetradesmus obliquus]